MDWARTYANPAAFAALGVEQPPRPSVGVGLTPGLDISLSVERSIELLQNTSSRFFKQSGCFACHAQPAADLAVSAARNKGIAVDEDAARERVQQSTLGLTTAGPVIMERQQVSDGLFHLVETLARSGYKPDRLTDFVTAVIASAQSENGSWPGRLGVARTPIQDGDFSRTAMAIRALKTYGSPGRSVEYKDRIERASQWLRTAEPVVTEDFAMRLAGLSTAGTSQAELDSLARVLLGRQRVTGGWSQLAEWPSDAYATGMSLSVMAEAGVLQTNDPRYQKAVRFLLSTQKLDGSWHVASRAARFQPYFESGFPYGHDQWISMMGTGWAANALALAIDTSLPAQ